MKAKYATGLAALMLIAGIALGQTSIGSVFRLTRTDESNFPAPSALIAGGLMYGSDAGALYVTNGVKWKPLNLCASAADISDPPNSFVDGQICNDLSTTQQIKGPKWFEGSVSVGNQVSSLFSANPDLSVLHQGFFGPPGDNEAAVVTIYPGISSSGGVGLQVSALDGTSPVQPKDAIVATTDGTVPGGSALVAYGGNTYGIGVTAFGSPRGPAGDFYSGGDGDTALDAPAIRATSTGGNYSVPLVCDSSGGLGAAIRLTPRSGAPTSPQEGDVWIETGGATDGLHYYLGGTDHLVTAVPP